MAYLDSINSPIVNLTTIFDATGSIKASIPLFGNSETLAGYQFVPLMISLEATEVVSLTSVPTITMGTNSSSFNNILTAAPMTGVNAAYKTLQFSPNSLVSSFSSLGFLMNGLTVYASVPAVATAYMVRASLIAFYYVP
jgi:hypothetical protein